jgi:putative ABC transport system permease protein
VKLSTLALRSLVHYWRTNLATALGLAIAAAVLAGATVVGDSVRASLRDLAFSRLGRTDNAVIANGFFREALADGAPMIAMEAVVTHDASGRRASRVSVYAVDQRFFQLHQRAQTPPVAGEVLLSPALATELGAQPDDSILVRIPRVSAIPTESLHGNKEDPGRTLRARMREVISRDAMGEFSLSPTQGDVRAVFLPLDRMQREFDLKGRVNTLLLTSNVDLRSRYRLEDIGLRRKGEQLEHETLVMNDEIVRAIRSVDAQAQPVFTYLANSILVNGREVPYSLVAAMDRADLPDDNSIVLNEWAAKDAGAKVGDNVELEYYLWDPSGRLITKSATFRLAAITPVNEADKELAPEYPGISGAESVADWDPPFPLELKRIRKQDEEYWDRYRATPKAYIRLAAGQNLWRSRYGAATSVRVSPNFDMDRLRSTINPVQAGLTLIDARAQAEQSSRGSTDFGEYFGYFSFFLLVSALLLAGLFFRFGLEHRAGEIATLRAVGFGGPALRKLYLSEALLLGLIGGLIAVVGALLYGALILTGLRTWWIDAVGTRDLSLHVSAPAVLTALFSSLVIGPLVVWLSLRSMLRTAPRETKTMSGRGRWVALLALVGGIALLFVGGPGGFFGAGALLLTASLMFLLNALRGSPGTVTDLKALGIRYTSHRPGRSALCVALIASATFLIVAVDAFRRDTRQTEGAWRLFGESAIPLYHDPNTEAGREALNLTSAPATKWLPFRLRPGDDASCLNLYAPRNPRVLGVPASYLQLAPGTAAVDANTLQYVLHKKVGDSLEVGGTKFTIAQTLSDTVFQSEILISDADFQKSFPEEQGYRVFLIDTAAGAEGELETALADYGLDVTSVAERIASFHRVENTWLSTFQALGGLGLLLGTLGLGAVLLRNMLERRRELALLRAVGYGPSHLSRVTFAENLFLLLAGLAIGAGCALIAVLPTVLARGGSVPIASIGAVLLAVLAAGVVSTAIAARIATRAPVLDALRSE